ncbi:MAG: hypothetical protein V1834_00975, partial [Candidatus Micrarchaeota archaeon]
RSQRPLECELLDNYLFGDWEDAFACYPHLDSNGNCGENAIDKVTCTYSHTEQTPVFDIPSGTELEETDVYICSNGKSFRDGPRKTSGNGNTVNLPNTPTATPEASPGSGPIIPDLMGSQTV